MQRILALGGGSFMMEDAPSPIDSYMLSLTGKAKPRVCFVSTPSGDHPEHIDKFYVAFGPELCTPSHLAFFRKPIPGSVPLADLESRLLDQDLIFVGGGNTKSALAVWREWHLDEVFRRALTAGVVLSGVSAGAMCWFESGRTDSFWGAGFQPLPCLGLLPGSCGVHYNSEPERKHRLAAALEARTISHAMFTLGCEYTRDEIHAQLGGSTVSCLPTRNGVIVAACLSKKFSPQAPEIVLCGQGARTGPVSELFSRQRIAIPVFIKNASSRWQYRGQFLVARSFNSGTRFKSFIAGSDRSVASVSHVVMLKQAE